MMPAKMLGLVGVSMLGLNGVRMLHLLQRKEYRFDSN
jgi:hypothetical protein